MLMTYPSPENPLAAEGVELINVPVGCRHLKPDGDSGEERKSAFELQFSRSRKLLHFIARRILNCVQEAEEAVKNCRLTAPPNPPKFTTQGAFKTCLARILPHGATPLLPTKQTNSTPSSHNPPHHRPH